MLLRRVMTSRQRRLVPQEGCLATNPRGQVEGYCSKFLRGAGDTVVPSKNDVGREPEEHPLAEGQGKGNLDRTLAAVCVAIFNILDGIIHFDLSSPPAGKMNRLFIVVLEED